MLLLLLCCSGVHAAHRASCSVSLTTSTVGWWLDSVHPQKLFCQEGSPCKVCKITRHVIQQA
jgi:hypothetical protein